RRVLQPGHDRPAGTRRGAPGQAQERPHRRDQALVPEALREVRGSGPVTRRRKEGRTEIRQIIWVRPGASAFAAPCEACEFDRRTPPAIARGTWRGEAAVGFVPCWRAHRVRVKRIPRTPAAAA